MTESTSLIQNWKPLYIFIAITFEVAINLLRFILFFRIVLISSTIILFIFVNALSLDLLTTVFLAINSLREQNCI